MAENVHKTANDWALEFSHRVGLSEGQTIDLQESLEEFGVDAFKRGESEGYHTGVGEAAAFIEKLTDERDVLAHALKEKADELATVLTCCGCKGQCAAPVFCPLCVELDRPGWIDYEIDTDDVGTLEGFDGVIVTTGEINASAGIRMSRETARTLADRLDALLRKLERQRRTSATGGDHG